MSLIHHVFEELRARGEGALVGYIMAGDPTPEQTPLIADALIEGGVDILELGLPFSDPIADGPTIQSASVRALASGTTPKITLETVHGIRRKHNTPTVVMTYYNPVFKLGLAKFFSQAKACSVDGLIVPDLPVEEAAEYVENAKAYDIDTVFLSAPSTSPERLRKIIACSSGFLYLVSRFGVTGERTEIEESTIKLIKRTLPLTQGRIPLVVGFGVSKPEHVRRIINAGAQGAVVGSAFVNIIQKNRGEIRTIVEELTGLAREFKAATRC
jgi:tryptophan synthase alpha chain